MFKKVSIKDIKIVISEEDRIRLAIFSKYGVYYPTINRFSLNKSVTLMPWGFESFMGRYNLWYAIRGFDSGFEPVDTESFSKYKKNFIETKKFGLIKLKMIESYLNRHYQGNVKKYGKRERAQ